MTDPLLEKVFGKGKQKVPPAERTFELRLSEYKTTNTFQITTKLNPTEMLNSKPAVKKKLMSEFEKLADALLK